MTLIKLRRYTTNFELSRMFNISESSVKNIVLTWILFMAKQWKEINNWPSRNLVRYFSPSDFNAKFPTIRVIIDRTECPIKKPKAPRAQQSTLSTYKVSKVAKIRNRYKQVPHLTQDTNGKVTNSQKTPQTRAKRSALSQQVTTKHI